MLIWSVALFLLNVSAAAGATGNIAPVQGVNSSVSNPLYLLTNEILKRQLQAQDPADVNCLPLPPASSALNQSQGQQSLEALLSSMQQIQNRQSRSTKRPRSTLKRRNMDDDDEDERTIDVYPQPFKSYESS